MEEEEEDEDIARHFDDWRRKESSLRSRLWLNQLKANSNFFSPFAPAAGLVPGTQVKFLSFFRPSLNGFIFPTPKQNRRAKWRKSERLKEDQRKRDGSEQIGDDDKVSSKVWDCMNRDIKGA